MYSKIKKFYDLGLYDDAKVAVFVQKGIIIADQYKEITGKDYE